MIIKKFKQISKKSTHSNLVCSVTPAESYVVLHFAPNRPTRVPLTGVVVAFIHCVIIYLSQEIESTAVRSIVAAENNQKHDEHAHIQYNTNSLENKILYTDTQNTQDCECIVGLPLPVSPIRRTHSRTSSTKLNGVVNRGTAKNKTRS